MSSPNAAIIQLPSKQCLVTLIDASDFEWLSSFCWREYLAHTGSYYAAAQFPSPQSKSGVGTRQMQRVIMDPEWRLHRSVLVDHINGNTLDNRRENLRLVDSRVSNLNRSLFRHSQSKYRWVHEHSPGRWRVLIRTTKDGRRFHSALRLFDNPHDAAEAANEIALRLFGPDARLNVIRRGEAD